MLKYCLLYLRHLCDDSENLSFYNWKTESLWKVDLSFRVFLHFKNFWLHFFFRTFQEAVSALRVLKTLLARVLPLFVYNIANCTLGNVVDSSSFAVITLVGHFFEQRPFLGYLQYHLSYRFICMWPKEQLYVSKRPREHTAVASPLSLCVGHFAELLEDCGSGWKELGQFL